MSAADTPSVDAALRAITLVRAVARQDEAGIERALDGADADRAALVAVHTARITAAAIADSDRSVEEVCRELRRQVTPYRRPVLLPTYPPIPDFRR